eukprot:gene29889-37017_t
MPLQQRLRLAAVEAILEGRLPPGATLPSSRELAKALGLSRNTVTSAYMRLIDDGFLEAHPRSGVFVKVHGDQRPSGLSKADWRAKPLPEPVRTPQNQPEREAPAMTQPTSPDWSARLIRSLSDRRTLAKPDQWRQYPYPFVYGTFDPQLFPTEAFRECCVHSLARDWIAGTPLNLERALTAHKPLGGHMMSGHVDGVGHLVEKHVDARSWRLSFEAPQLIARYIARKGSIAIDGVSLTVNAVAGSRFEVNIVPHTWENTTLGALVPGSKVNLEVDLIARYLERLLEISSIHPISEARPADARERTLDSIEDIVADIRAGKMVVIMDDEDRENEGDLIMAASLCRPEDINFMARFGRGLICLTLTAERCRQLRLPPMVAYGDDLHQTAFTVSIEASKGVTTGISAHDRAHTVQAAVKADARPEDLVQPGHIFPLM